MKKRLHGQGSIFKRTDGRIVARLELPPGPDGKRRHRDFYARTERAALRKLDEARVAARQGTLAPAGAGRVTVGDLLDEWLDGLDTPHAELKELTREQYRTAARTRLKPYLGNVPIAQLDHERIQKWQDALLDADYAPRSVLKARVVLEAVITIARRRKLLPSDPLELVDAPSAKRPSKRAITGEEAGRFLRVIRGHEWETLFLADLLVGGRRGELLGWTWSNIDLDDATVRIERQVQRVLDPGKRKRKDSTRSDGTRPQLVELKTEASDRLLPLPSLLVDQLRSLRDMRQIGAELVWSEAGKPIDPRRFNKEFQIVVTKAGLAPLTPHELRHSVSTILHALGVPSTVVADYLGHSDPSVTLRWYTHSVPESLREAAARMDDYVRRLDQEHGSDEGMSVTSSVNVPPDRPRLSSKSEATSTFSGPSQS